MRRLRPTREPGEVISQLVTIGGQLESATRALRSLVEELRADLPSNVGQADPGDEDEAGENAIGR